MTEMAAETEMAVATEMVEATEMAEMMATEMAEMMATEMAEMMATEMAEMMATEMTETEMMEMTVMMPPGRMAMMMVTIPVRPVMTAATVIVIAATVRGLPLVSTVQATARVDWSVSAGCRDYQPYPQPMKRAWLATGVGPTTDTTVHRDEIPK
jgi:hypothetical protein